MAARSTCWPEIVEQKTDLTVGAHPVVFVVDEFRGNGHLINAIGANSASPGGPGAPAGPTQPTDSGSPGGDGDAGGAGGHGGTVTVMCRRSSGVRISVSGGSGAAGGAGGNGGPGSPATSTPGATITETQIDADGNLVEVEVHRPDIETPGDPGRRRGHRRRRRRGRRRRDDPVHQHHRRHRAGARGDRRPRRPWRSRRSDRRPRRLRRDPGRSGHQPGRRRNGRVRDRRHDQRRRPCRRRSTSRGLRPLLDAEGRDFANHWAPYRLLVGQYFYRQHRKSQPAKGQEAADRVRPDPRAAARQRRRAALAPPAHGRPAAPARSPDIEWEPGGLNALGLPRDLDVLPRFEDYRDAFTSFGNLVVEFLSTGATVLLQNQDLEAWRTQLDDQRRQAEAAEERQSRTANRP